MPDVSCDSLELFATREKERIVTLRSATHGKASNKSRDVCLCERTQTHLEAKIRKNLGRKTRERLVLPTELQAISNICKCRESPYNRK